MTTTSDRAKNIVLIAGPTGSGKTDLAVALARHYGTSVVSADSRQIYRGMAVGTAQPAPLQLEQVKHYFIASHDPQDEFTAGRYETEALAVLEEIFETQDLAIVAGGSGMYIDALCYGMDEMPDIEPQIRSRLNSEFNEHGLEKLTAELRASDPDYYNVVDLNNPQRVIRALEVYRQTGRPFSAFRSGRRKPRPFGIVKLGTILPRQSLYARIDMRVDEMLTAGLEEEARKLYPLRHLSSLQTVGYKELFDYFDGTITFDRAVELIKRNSRRYAKRQLTWFGRDPGIKWLSSYAVDEAVRHIDKNLTRNN
ncbi:MAG: tRNA (adenosine(37)-N6)-dimethylallyltransferase MiaA [Alistipes sp.]|nr:tRNA (adenosine(37)-N6)-dimethylallyltransferase MiaA [Alistipes sp.]